VEELAGVKIAHAKVVGKWVTCVSATYSDGDKKVTVCAETAGVRHAEPII
jgi:hypothetical protein